MIILDHLKFPHLENKYAWLTCTIKTATWFDLIIILLFIDSRMTESEDNEISFTVKVISLPLRGFVNVACSLKIIIRVQKK